EGKALDAQAPVADTPGTKRPGDGAAPARPATPGAHGDGASPAVTAPKSAAAVEPARKDTRAADVSAVQDAVAVHTPQDSEAAPRPGGAQSGVGKLGQAAAAIGTALGAPATSSQSAH